MSLTGLLSIATKQTISQGEFFRLNYSKANKNIANGSGL